MSNPNKVFDVIINDTSGKMVNTLNINQIDLTNLAQGKTYRLIISVNPNYRFNSGSDKYITVNGIKSGQSSFNNHRVKVAFTAGYINIQIKNSTDDTVGIGSATSGNSFTRIDSIEIGFLNEQFEQNENPKTPTNNLINAHIVCGVASNSVKINCGYFISSDYVPLISSDYIQSPYIMYDGAKTNGSTRNVFISPSVVSTMYECGIPYDKALTLTTVQVFGEGLPITSGITITNNLQNASCDNLQFDVTSSNNSYTITPSTKYDFETPPYLTIVENGNSYTLNFTKNNNVWVLTVDGTVYPNADTVSVNGVAVRVIRTKAINTSGLVNITPTANCDLVINDVKTSYHFECKINDGCTLQGKIEFMWRQDSGDSPIGEELTYDSETDTYSYDFDLWQNPETFFDNQTNPAPYFSGRAISETELLSDYGAIHVYKTSKQINQALVNKRFYNVTTNQYEDMGNYIISFVRYPFNVTTQDSENIKYGWFDTQINAPLVDNQIFTLSLGKVAVNGLYGDSSDIKNVRIKILLPYADIYELDSIYINTEIEVKYKIDVLSNSCVIEIYSDDKLIDSLNTSIGYDIPYILKTDRVTPNVNLTSNILKKRTPAILIYQKAKVNGLNYITDVKRGLSNISGYVKCNIVELSINAQMTTTEQNAIKQALQNGVIF